MSTIGGITLTIVDGVLAPSSAEYRAFTRLGVDGTGVLFGNRHDDPQKLTTVDLYDTMVNALSAIDAAELLERTQVTLIDQFGRTWTNVAVARLSSHINYVVHPTTPWAVILNWDVILES